jgi:hypothetical protein
MVFNAIFNSLLVVEIRVTGENHQSLKNLIGIQAHNISGDRHELFLIFDALLLTSYIKYELRHL